MTIKDVNFEYKAGISTCFIETDNGLTAVGQAFCHEEDLDMMSEKTGNEIAYKRAKIDLFRLIRDYDLKPRLQALHQLYYSMKHSTHFNAKSYENKMLQRQIRLIKFDLETIKELIAEEQIKLKKYINSKDAFYKTVRKNRGNGQN